MSEQIGKLTRRIKTSKNAPGHHSVLIEMMGKDTRPRTQTSEKLPILKNREFFE